MDEAIDAAVDNAVKETRDEALDQALDEALDAALGGSASRIAAEEAARKAAEESARIAAEEAERKAAEESARIAAEEAEKKAAEEATRIAAEEAEKKAAEEAARIAAEEAERKAAEESARIAAEEAARKAAEEAARIAAEEAERKAAEESARIAAEEAEKKAAEESTRIAADEAEKKAAEESARIAAEEAARKAAEESARIAAEEAAKKADEESARIAAEEAARKAAEESARIAAEEAEKKVAEEAARLADEEAARIIAEEAKKKADEESARIAAEEAQKKAAEESARIAAEEAAKKADEESARIAAEEAEKKVAEEAARLADEEAARIIAEEAKKKADEESARIAAAEAAARPTVEDLNKEGVTLVKAGNLEEAAAKFSEALKVDPSNTGARFNLAFTYQQMDKDDEAEVEYRKVLESEDLARAHLMLGVLYEEKEDYGKAAEEFERVLKKEPGNKVAHTKLEGARGRIAAKDAEKSAADDTQKKAAEEPAKIAETPSPAAEAPPETVPSEAPADKPAEPAIKRTLAGLFGVTDIPVLADTEGQFVESMAKNQVIEGETPSQVNETDLLESIRTGRQFNRESLAASARTEQARAQTGQALGLMLPSVNVRASRGRETSEPSVVPDPMGNLKESDTHMRSDASLTITQPLFDLPSFREWHRRKAKELSRGESYRTSDGDAFISTVGTYLTLVSSKLQADVMRDFEAKLAELLAYIEKRADAGAASVSDMSRVRARSQATLSTRLEQESAHLAAGTEFVRLTNVVPQKVRLPVVEDVGATVMPASFDEAVEAAMKSNPEIATLTAELEAEKIDESAAKGRFFPKVDAEYTDTYADHAGGSPDDQRDKRLMLVLNWNLYSGGRDSKLRVERRARHKELQYRMDDQRRRVVQTLAANYSALETTRARIAAGYQELDSITTAMEAMSKRMLSGNQSLLDLLDVYDRFYQVRSRLVNLHVLEMNKVAEIVRLTSGTPWPAHEISAPPAGPNAAAPVSSGSIGTERKAAVAN